MIGGVGRWVGDGWKDGGGQMGGEVDRMVCGLQMVGGCFSYS